MSARVVGGMVAALGLALLIVCAQFYIVDSVVQALPSLPILGQSRGGMPVGLLLGGQLVGALMMVGGAALTQSEGSEPD